MPTIFLLIFWDCFYLLKTLLLSCVFDCQNYLKIELKFIGRKRTKGFPQEYRICSVSVSQRIHFHVTTLGFLCLYSVKCNCLVLLVNFTCMFIRWIGLQTGSSHLWWSTLERGILWMEVSGCSHYFFIIFYFLILFDISMLDVDEYSILLKKKENFHMQAMVTWLGAFKKRIGAFA